MAITFRYRILDHAGTSKKPVVKVTLQGRNQTPVEVLGLLDSGADISVIPRGLAEFLALRLGAPTSSKGIGGEIRVRDARLNVQVRANRGHEVHQMVDVPCQVADDDGVPIIIGRRGFFDKFTVTIDERKGSIRLKRNNERS